MGRLDYGRGRHVMGRHRSRHRVCVWCTGRLHPLHRPNLFPDVVPATGVSDDLLDGLETGDEYRYLWVYIITVVANVP
jgi:hypothetical protein